MTEKRSTPVKVPESQVGRQATDALGGYFYQLDHAVMTWLTLGRFCASADRLRFCYAVTRAEWTPSRERMATFGADVGSISKSLKSGSAPSRYRTEAVGRGQEWTDQHDAFESVAGDPLAYR